MNQQKLPQLRRPSQILFLLLFLLLMMKTESFSSLRAVRDGVRIPYPVSFFLQLDLLAALSSALASHSLYRGLLWSMAILIPTFFLGRFFCGWICPLGTLNHFLGSWKSERKRGPERLERNRYKKWQTLKYYLLIAGLVSAVFGGSLLGILDPISLTVRSLGTAVFPAINYGLDAFLNGLHHSPVAPLRTAGYIAQLVLNETLLSFRQPHYHQAFFLGAIFIAILALNLRVTRFWCRALCPLGALLGIASRWSVLGLEKLPDHCNDCNRCLLDCQGGDDPHPHTKWRKAECHLCFNCVAACGVAPGFSPASVGGAASGSIGAALPTKSGQVPAGATSLPETGIRFKFFPATKTTIETPNLQRRRALAGVAAGASLLPILRTGPGFAAEKDPRLIRPPGALDEGSFLARCIRCGECMKVCPNNALQPALAEAGLEGLWSPVLVPRLGYCEPSCVLCGEVCPTGAIWEITAAEKAWLPAGAGKDAKPIRLGTAFFDRGHCLPWAMATECIVCEEWCPTSPKAIYLRPVEVTDSLGAVKQIRQPYVDPNRCVGCGACEFACPIKDHPAVYVTSIGETRSKTNQILLNRRENSPRSEVRGPRSEVKFMNSFLSAHEGFSSRKRFLSVLCALKSFHTEATERLCDLCVKALEPRSTRRNVSWWRQFSYAATIILAGLLVGCRSHAPSPADFYPATNAVAGWVKSSDTRTFEASHLWEYIDGDADKYLQAGEVKTLTSDYRFNGKTDATVDVYVLGAAAGAKKIYDAESAEGSQPATVGDAGRYAKGSLTFRQGPYFVRLVAYEDTPEISKGLVDLASAVSSRLGQGGQ